MNWHDLEIIWRRQEPPAGADANLAALRQTFEVRHRKLALSLLIRDYSEAGAGAFVAVVFGFMGWRMGSAGWPFMIVVALVLGLVAFFLRERVRARRRRLGTDASLLAKIDADITELRHQRRLLLNVGLWYLGPIVAVLVIVGATVTYHSKPYALQRDPWFHAIMFLFNATLIGWVWWLNRRTVRKVIEPRLAELEKLRRELASTA